MAISAAQKVVVPVMLGQGLDTKTDPKHLPAGRLTVLENAVQKKRYRYEKRDGNVRIPNVKVGGGSVPAPDSLAVFNDELLEYAGQHLWSYSAGAQAWVDKGPVVSALVRSQSIIRNTAQQTQADSATNNGVSVYAWEDSRGGVRASVVDEETGTTLLSDTLLDASASRVRCVAFSAFLYVFYYKAGSLYVQRINPVSPTAFDAAVQVSSTVNTVSPTYDVYAYSNLRMMWVHNVQASSAVNLGWLSDSPAVLSGTLSPSAVVAEAATNALAIVAAPQNTFCIAYHNGTGGVRAVIINNGATVLYGPLTVEALTSAAVVNITGAATQTGVQLFYEVAAATAPNQYVRTNAVTTAGVAGTPADFLRSVGLWSKAWSYTDGHGNIQTYLGVVRSSPLQATFFVARSDGLILAKQQPTLASGLTSRPILQNVWSAQTGVFSYALLTKTRLVSENATIFTPTGVTKTALDFQDQEIFTAAQLGNNLHVVGGVLGMYDGLSVVEHGFHLYPEVMSFTTSTAGGGLGKAVYQYVAMYEWTDNFGQVHRSAGSVPLSVDLTGSSTTTNSVTVTADTLRLTAKKGTRTNVSVVLYRSEANNGTLFYRVSSVLSPTFNDPTADSVTFTDTLADTALISNEILYTAGGTLDNTGTPACAAIAVYKNRLWLAGLEDSNTTWFSQEHKSGSPVEFSDQLTKNVEPTSGGDGGGLTALYVIDDKLLGFKADRYYFTYGDGPNAQGAGDNFPEFTFVTADVGCTNASSIVRLPSGIMLKTAKGIYQVDANLTPSYVGQEVEDYNGLTITSAVLHADVNQVRFTTSSGPALVYDYNWGQWGVFTNYAAVDAVLWRGSYVTLKPTGAVWQETPGIHTDDGSPVRVRIGTGWISVAGVFGIQRVYKYGILGEYKSPHTIQVQVGYDFSDAYLDSDFFNPDQSLPVTHLGDGATFGADQTFGGEPIAYQYVSELRIQQCRSVRFLIEELTTAATPGTQEAFNITTLGLLAAVKPGMAKLKGSLNKGMGG